MTMKFSTSSLPIVTAVAFSRSRGAIPAREMIKLRSREWLTRDCRVVARKSDWSCTPRDQRIHGPPFNRFRLIWYFC